jgi:outer membrane autotransporter protein
MSNAAALINTMAAAMPITWFAELDSVTQRLGDLRLETREKGGIAAWVRGYGQKLNFNKKVSGQNFNERQLGAETGVDYKFGGSTHNVYAGAFAGYGQATRNYDTAGAGATDSAYGGLYQTFATKSGFYADGVLKMNSFKNRFTAKSPTGETMRADYHNWAIGASLEIGQRIELPYDWFIEPQIQAAFTIVTDKTYAAQADDGGITTVGQTPGTTTRGRAGFKLGRTIETEKWGTYSWHVKGYGGGQWMTGGVMTVTVPAPGGRNGRYAPAIKGYYFEGGIGFAWLINKRTQIYFDYDTTDAEFYVKPYGFNLAFRHMW